MFTRRKNVWGKKREEGGDNKFVVHLRMIYRGWGRKNEKRQRY